MQKHIQSAFGVILLCVTVLFVFPLHASAHCDTFDGPVVAAARKAMKTDNVNYILIWVKPENEDQIRKALKRANDKRKKAKSKEEKEKAEMELFEMLVRIHREGEGAPYEGIKPVGSIEPEIALADTAVKTGTLDEVLHHIESAKNREILRHLFHKVQETSQYEIDNVSEGREFIESYVLFIHAVENAIKGKMLEIGKLHDH